MPRILIVEDSEYSRILLKNQLAKLGHDVVMAEDGVQAWQILKKQRVNVLITDWMMPNMDGIELCRKIRASRISNYIYIILLTVKDERNDMLEGIDAGADNFLTKPCTLAELRVMLLTAQRMIKYERALLDRNRKLSKAHEELKRGLKSAGAFHKTLLPPSETSINGIRFQSFSKACEYATGDMFNYYLLDENTLVFYLLDVAGHGVPAAMLSFTLSHFLAPTEAITHTSETGTFLDLRSPTMVTEALNRKFQQRTDDWLSFTMVYGVIDLETREVRFTQAGHPPLIHKPKYQEAKTIGEGGFPIGFFDNVAYDEYSFILGPGDRIILYSDGITECSNAENESYGMDRFLKCINQTNSLNLKQSLDHIYGCLKQWHGSENFKDDFSLLSLQCENPD